MSEIFELQARDRVFFQILTKFAFSNPFDNKSLQLAYTLAGGQYPVGDALTEKVVERVGKRLEKSTFNGKINWHHFSGEDRELVRVALLHDTYHRCCLNFDDLILKQIEADHSACLVPFAKDNLLLLRKRGFNVEDSLRYFGFFYQLRRAWYFINHGLIGQSGAMGTLRAQLWRTVFTSRLHWYENFLWNRMEDFSTFLIGETGTGKGTAAAAIGRSGFIPFDEKKGCFIESFASNFIEINLSQFPESLIESELFGHKKGAFTGAVDSHKGVFALCSPHGSIFLDEIGDVSIPIQIKLLKVLEERNFSAVGSHEKLHFHGRIVTATNKSLAVLQQQQTFREDFYYRLCSNIITVPTFREQIRNDPFTLEVLLDHTILRIIGEPAPELLQLMLQILEREVGPDYHWPGNVRELEQAVRSILLTLHYRGNTGGVPAGLMGQLQIAIERESVSAQELLSSYCYILYQRHGTFGEVAQITKLDPRTVKKHIQTQVKKRKM
jgi:hypothetical protein